MGPKIGNAKYCSVSLAAPIKKIINPINRSVLINYWLAIFKTKNIANGNNMSIRYPFTKTEKGPLYEGPVTKWNKPTIRAIKTTIIYRIILFVILINQFYPAAF